MRKQRSRLLMVLLASCGLAGCGTVVPNIKEAWDSDIPGDPNGPHGRRAPIAGAGQIEFEIKKQIFCDLRHAVHEANIYYVKTTEGKKGDYLPKDWAAQVSLSLEVDESSALNPGVAFNNPMASAISTFGVVNKTPVTVTTPQLFSLGVGGTLSSTATRTDKFDPYWTIEELSKEITEESVCNPERPKNDPFVEQGFTPAKSSPLIESDLGLTEWLLGALVANDLIPSVTGPRSLTAEEVVAERQVLQEKRFTKPETTLIVASGAFTSSLVDLDEDRKLQLKKLKKKLKNELQELLKKYTRTQIANFLADGASPSELQGFLKSGYDIAEITELMKAKAKASASGGGGGSGGGGKPDTLTIEIKFVIVSSGNVLPTWKLVRVSSGTGSTPLFGIGRTRTHDVIITIGPRSQETRNTHLASQIGVAVSNANRAAISATTPSNTFTFPPFAF